MAFAWRSATYDGKPKNPNRNLALENVHERVGQLPAAWLGPTEPGPDCNISYIESASTPDQILKARRVGFHSYGGEGEQFIGHAVLGLASNE